MRASGPRARRASPVVRLPVPRGALAFTLEHAGEEHLVVSLGTPREIAWPATLTASERAIAAHIVAGRSTEQIARARGRSSRTIANQIASLLRKLEVASRVQLAARLQ